MRRTLYLHIGMPKCASSTIQAALTEKSDLLASYGLSYPINQFAGTEGQGNATLLAAHIRANQTKAVQAELDLLFAGNRDVILSTEVMVGLSRHSEWLVDQAASRGLDVRVICYMRRQDHWIESDFKEHIKSTSNFSDAIQVLIGNRARSKVLNYHWLLSNWSHGVGTKNITIVPLRKGQTDAHALEKLVVWLGRDPELAQMLILPRRNISPAVALIEPARHLKRVLQLDGRGSAEIHAALGTFLTEAATILTLPARKFILTMDERRRLVGNYAELNASLSETFYGGQPVFDEDFEPEADGIGDLAEESSLLLAECAVRMDLFDWMNGSASRAVLKRKLSMSWLIGQARKRYR